MPKPPSAGDISVDPLTALMGKNATKATPISSADGTFPDFDTKYFPDYDHWSMAPVQYGLAKYYEYEDGTYDIEDWMNLHIMLSHKQRFIRQ